jgi:hydroxyacyl-ACP dehydratase HTD2-like protein with hotdog domain
MLAAEPSRGLHRGSLRRRGRIQLGNNRIETGQARRGVRLRATGLEAGCQLLRGRGVRKTDQHKGRQTESLHLPAFYSVDTFDSGDIYTFESEFFVLRNKELVDNGLDFPSGKLGTGSWYGNSFGPTPEVISKFSDMTFNSHKIYDNRKVSILVNRLQ